MILVDTSVWVDFFRGERRAEGLAAVLEVNEALLHPWVLGELALGGLGERRGQAIDDLKLLPAAPRVSDDEALELIGARRLFGRGIGWVDAHLLGSALVSGCELWTFDGRLARVARELEIPAPG